MKMPIKSNCTICGNEVISVGRTPRKVCPSKRDRKTGKMVYSKCALKYWANWKKANRQHYRKGGKYYEQERKKAKLEEAKRLNPNLKRRMCLGILCAEEEEPQYFMSTGIGNRQCERCKNASQGYNSERLRKFVKPF